MGDRTFPYILRPVERKDLDDLVELAQFLDTVNFPNDRDELEKDIDISIQSFLGELKDPRGGVYSFAVEDVDKKKVMGVSKILAHHGTHDKPHYYWQISYDRRESSTLGMGINHQVLKLGKDTQGHTEIAGIIVHPHHQGKQLGKLLFYVRMLYIAVHRRKFLNTTISELLPPFNKKGESELWEAYGRKFTGLTYQEADHLSQNNKEFIESLFPQNEIYTVLLPVKAREVIGKVGEKSKPVMHLAVKNGFVFSKQIDPFDGGPHYACNTDEIIAVRNTETGAAKALGKDTGLKLAEGLICKKGEQKQQFRALKTSFAVDHKNRCVFAPEETLQALKIDEGEEIAVLPFT